MQSTILLHGYRATVGSPPGRPISEPAISGWHRLTHPATKVGLAAVGGAGLLLADATAGRSFALWSLIGLWAILFGWALLTNAGGVWDAHKARENRRGERISRLPLGRLYWGMERSDSEIHRGLMGVSAVIAGIAFIVLGVLAGFDVVDVNGH